MFVNGDVGVGVVFLGRREEGLLGVVEGGGFAWSCGGRRDVGGY
jgi:hypothetical protein